MIVSCCYLAIIDNVVIQLLLIMRIYVCFLEAQSIRHPLQFLNQ